MKILSRGNSLETGLVHKLNLSLRAILRGCQVATPQPSSRPTHLSILLLYSFFLFLNPPSSVSILPSLYFPTTAIVAVRWFLDDHRLATSAPTSLSYHKINNAVNQAKTLSIFTQKAEKGRHRSGVPPQVLSADTQENYMHRARAWCLLFSSSSSCGSCCSMPLALCFFPVSFIWRFLQLGFKIFFFFYVGVLFDFFLITIIWIFPFSITVSSYPHLFSSSITWWYRCRSFS